MDVASNLIGIVAERSGRSRGKGCHGFFLCTISIQQ